MTPDITVPALPGFPLCICLRRKKIKKVTALVMFAVMTAALGFGQDGVDLDKRIEVYTQAIKNNPNDAEAYFDRGDVYLYDKGDYDRAIADYTQAMRLDPNDAAMYYFNRGDAYFNKGDYDKAIADYTQAIRLDSNDPAVYYFNRRGNAYFDKGDYNKAIADYSEAIKRGSSDLDAYRYRSFAYYHIKNYDAAIADCNTLIQRNPDFPPAYVARGDTYGAKGLYHKAVADYRTGFEKGYDPSGYTVDKSSKADMWFCGTMYMEIAVNRFPGNSAVVTKYENRLKTVCDKNNITRAEVETFYRQNIGALVAAAVDAEVQKRTIPAATLVDIKQRISAFYLTPNQTTFNALKDFYSRLTLENYGNEKIRMYQATLLRISALEKQGWSDVAASARENARAYQQELTPVARARNMTFEQFVAFPWDDVWSVFRSSLNGLSPALANRVTQ